MSSFDLSFNVASTLAANRGVAVSGVNTVIFPTTITTAVIGVTKDTVNDTNQGINVTVLGKVKLEFNDTITAGGEVAVDSSGKGIPYAGVTLTGTHVLGIALETVASTGSVAEILVQPYLRYGQA